MWPSGSTDTVCPRPPLTLTFDCLTLKLVSKVGNLPSKFGHARHLGSQFIHYVCDGRMSGRQTDRQTDKSNAYCLCPTVGGKTMISMITNIIANTGVQRQNLSGCRRASLERGSKNETDSLCWDRSGCRWGERQARDVSSATCTDTHNNVSHQFVLSNITFIFYVKL